MDSSDSASDAKSLSRYYRGSTLGKGTWGVVYQATRKSDGAMVAVKKIDTKGEGLDYSGIREIRHLQELKGGPFILNVSQSCQSCLASPPSW